MLFCLLVVAGAGPYHGVMIITAYVGVDQWLPMVTFRPDTNNPSTGAPSRAGNITYWSRQILCKTRIRTRLPLRLWSNLQSLEETPISSSLAAIKTESV